MSVKDKIPAYNSLVLPYHYLQAYHASNKYHHPARNLHVIGVTGTNGKTTTCFMIWKMLNKAGIKTGLMTTVAWGAPGIKNGDKDGLIKQVKHMTTVYPKTLNHRIKEIAETGATHLVLEVTSHALAQDRIMGIPIEIAVMTNVTHEHLDYHKTFENYVAAKCKLFKRAKFGIINADDPSKNAFISAINSSKSARNSSPKYTSYGIKNGKIRAKNLKLSSSGVNYSCSDIKPLKITTQIPGEFNVYNSLAALAVGKKVGLSDQQIVDGIYSLSEVEGRMNRLDFGQDFEVIVDFAHTPDAFEKVFSSVHPHKSGRIISLFGGAGRRDESTREERGIIAGKYSDICILTEDDSRDEKPEKIMSMFEEGCKKAGLKDDQIIKIVDRKKAIEKAISLAKKGDLVLILGKGHEKTILRADGAHPFEDLKVTTAAIKNRLNQK